MKTVKGIARWIGDSKGVATSLIEATATIAVGSVLAAVAVGGAIEAVNNSKVQAAISDVSSIGQGVLAFYQDNSFLPFYVDGLRTGPTDDFYGFLVSENGSYPIDLTLTATSGGWNLPTNSSKWPSGLAGTIGISFFGDKPDFVSGAAGHATIEGHLVRNILGDPTALTATAYPLRGDPRIYGGDPKRGWQGPYVTSLPKTDPWNDKYLVNVRNLNVGYLKTLPPDPVTGDLLKLAVIVISAGPNRNIETSVDQRFDSFKVGGDDIVFRLK